VITANADPTAAREWCKGVLRSF